MNISISLKSKAYSHFIKLQNLFSKGSLDYFKKEYLFLHFQDLKFGFLDFIHCVLPIQNITIPKPALSGFRIPLSCPNSPLNNLGV